VVADDLERIVTQRLPEVNLQNLSCPWAENRLHDLYGVEADTPSDGLSSKFCATRKGEVCAMMDEGRFSIFPLPFTANSAAPRP
jgi:hypothetical protein